MCGRYNITDDPLLLALMDSLGLHLHLPSRYNIAPTEFVPVVLETAGRRQQVTARWWLVPSWSDGPSTRYAMFNARAESLDKSRAYRGPFKSQRCILPASSFIEWHKQGDIKQPYEIKPVDRAIAFAGLWDFWEGQGQQLYSCTIITSAAPKAFGHIHARIPVMLNEDEIEAWLDVSTDHSTLNAMLVPSLKASLEVKPVNRAIGNSRHKDPPIAIGEGEILVP